MANEFEDFVMGAVSDCVNGPAPTLVWQQACMSIYREEHVYYVDGTYAGTVMRHNDRWSCWLSGKGGAARAVEVTGLDAGKAVVEAG